MTILFGMYFFDTPFDEGTLMVTYVLIWFVFLVSMPTLSGHSFTTSLGAVDGGQTAPSSSLSPQQRTVPQTHVMDHTRGTLVTLAKDTFYLEQLKPPGVYVVISISHCDDCVRRLAAFIGSDSIIQTKPLSVIFFATASQADRRECKKYARENFPTAQEVYFATSEMVVGGIALQPNIFTPSPFLILRLAERSKLLNYGKVFDPNGLVKTSLAQRLRAFYEQTE